MSYVDGFVIPVPAGNREAFIEMAKRTASIFVEHGATRVVECWGDDIPDGKVTDFRRAVQAEGGENVAFAWIFWPSREARDSGMKKTTEDPRTQMGPDMPFDGKRMIFGGFSVVVDTGEPR